MRNITSAKYTEDKKFIKFVIENDLGNDNKIVMEHLAPVDENNLDYQEVMEAVKSKKLKIEK